MIPMLFTILGSRLLAFSFSNKPQRFTLYFPLSVLVCHLRRFKFHYKRKSVHWQETHFGSLAETISWTEDEGEPETCALKSLSSNINPEISCFGQNGFSHITKDIVGRTIHGIYLKGLLPTSVFHANTLINMYSKFGRIGLARLIFEQMDERNEASWNNMMSGYVLAGMYPEAVRFFYEMCENGIKPSGFAIASLVTACDKSACMLWEGLQVHGHVVKFGFLCDVFIGTSLVHFYGSCGHVFNAQKIFDEMPNRNVVSWTSLMVGYSNNGNKEEVINLYQHMRRKGLFCNENTISTVISSCGMMRDECLGYQVLGHVVKYGLDANVSAANSLISMLGSCGNVAEASYIFNQMEEQDTISWNSIISANASNGFCEESLRLFYKMRYDYGEINSTTLSILLSTCGSVDDLRWGKGIHGLVVKLGFEFNVCLSNTLLNMYSEAGRSVDAVAVFQRMTKKDVISWNSMLACYMLDENYTYAFKIFTEMLRLKKEINYVTFTSALAACSNLDFLDEGKILHTLALVFGLQENLIVGNALITMYGKSGDMAEAEKIFRRMPKRDKVTWNTLIGGYADNKEPNQAVKAFWLMQEKGVQADYITIVNILGACLTPSCLGKHGISIHGHTIITGFDSDKQVQSSLITMYAKCGDLDSSRYIFDRLANRNPCIWNAIISANARFSAAEEALKLIVRMRRSGIDLDQFSFSLGLSAAADLAMLEEGQQLHSLAVKMGFESDYFVINVVMDMYGKCGEIDDALRILPQPINRSRLSWNTLISVFARHGYFQHALSTFQEMVELGIEPDHVTFVCILSACNHGGLVDEGLRFYSSMTSTFSVRPGIEHCVCIIDLLGRSGRLKEAEAFIKELPIPPNDLAWRSLLASCKIHRNLDIGREAAEHLLELDPSDDSAYVLYSNALATTGRWKDVENVREQMKIHDIKKKPACSWVKYKSKVSKFRMGDQTHPQIDQINAKLAELMKMIRETGYVPDTTNSLQDIDEEEKEQNLWKHSERIALAFGLINSPKDAPVKVFKNLRVCEDCHSFYALVSMIIQRKIVLRDPYRFHHFSAGSCSCSDYW